MLKDQKVLFRFIYSIWICSQNQTGSVLTGLPVCGGLLGRAPSSAGDGRASLNQRNVHVLSSSSWNATIKKTSLKEWSGPGPVGQSWSRSGFQSSSTVGVMVTPLRICPQPIRLRQTNRTGSVPHCEQNFSGFWPNLPPMFLHTPAQSDLLPHLRAHRVGEHDLGQVSLDGADPAACGQRADVDHQNLVLGQLLDLESGRWSC